GVDEDLLLILLFRVGREVQDEEPERQRDLVGGQPDPAGVVHQFEHRAYGRAQRVVDLLDRTGCVSQRGMRVFDDLEHESSSLPTISNRHPVPERRRHGDDRFPDGRIARPRRVRVKSLRPGGMPRASGWVLASFYGLAREIATALSGLEPCTCGAGDRQAAVIAPTWYQDAASGASARLAAIGS